MSSRVNLNDNTSDRYEFSIGGLDYDFVYPTLEQVEPITDLYNAREKETKKENPDDAVLKDIDNKLEEALYGLVVPVGHTTPIKETLKKQSFKVVQAFNKMMTEQMTAE